MENKAVSPKLSTAQGGGFCFYKLGVELFASEGAIYEDVRFAELAAYIWFYETHMPWQGTAELSLLLGVS